MVYSLLALQLFVLLDEVGLLGRLVPVVLLKALRLFRLFLDGLVVHQAASLNIIFDFVNQTQGQLFFLIDKIANRYK